MKKTIIRLIILIFVFSLALFIAGKNSFAITLVVDQNIGEYDFYEFGFGPITESTLTFDYILTTALDSGDPYDPLAFSDSFYCGLTLGTDYYDLLVADSTGNYPDPFWTAPGTVTVTPSSAPGFSYTLTADISSLMGLSGNIYFELADWGDGYDTTVEFDNIAFGTPSAVPEPSIIFLLSSLLLGGFLINRRLLVK